MICIAINDKINKSKKLFTYFRSGFVFSSVNKQISILLSRGLVIKNISEVKKILKFNNYYNIIDGFKTPFLDLNSKDEKFKKGTTFEEIYSLYLFDRTLRSLIMEYSLLCENSLKSLMSYYFSKTNGEYAYLDSNKFIFSGYGEKKDTIKLLNQITNKIELSKNNPIYTHFINSNKDIPLWVVVNFLDFGSIREFYNCAPANLKFEIANSYNIDISTLKSFISTINMFRNVCAHDNRLMYYRIFKKGISYC